MTQAPQTNAHPALISYPPQSAFGRPLPKNKIYEHGAVNTRLKSLFVQQVEQIVWQHKLAPETINLPAKPGVPEIQVFALHLKTPELHTDVLRCIDDAVQFPIVFELHFDGRTQVVAACKRPSAADFSRWMLSDYFASGWLPDTCPRAAMPLALDLGSLYEQLLLRLTPVAPRPQESLADLIARVALIHAKQREVDKTASRLASEKQFNRKVEINGTLRQLHNELEQLRC